MTDPPSAQEPLSLRQAVDSVLQSPFRLSIAATVLVALAMITPMIGVRMDLGFVAQSLALSGEEAGGWVAWITLILFALAAASRKVDALYPYRSLLELAAAAGATCTLLYAWFLNPAADVMRQSGEIFRQFQPASAVRTEMLRQYPHIGMILLVAALLLLMLARRRDRAGGAV